MKKIIIETYNEAGERVFPQGVNWDKLIKRLTGILELTGLELCNKNIYSRSIYVHGTNKEKSLGGKHSNGCVRVSNDDILFLLNSIKVGTKLYVKP